MVSRRTILARIISVALSIVLVAASMGVTSYAETVQDLELLIQHRLKMLLGKQKLMIRQQSSNSLSPATN